MATLSLFTFLRLLVMRQMPFPAYAVLFVSLCASLVLGSSCSCTRPLSPFLDDPAGWMTQQNVIDIFQRNRLVLGAFYQDRTAEESEAFSLLFGDLALIYNTKLMPVMPLVMAPVCFVNCDLSKNPGINSSLSPSFAEYTGDIALVLFSSSMFMEYVYQGDYGNLGSMCQWLSNVMQDRQGLLNSAYEEKSFGLYGNDDLSAKQDEDPGLGHANQAPSPPTEEGNPREMGTGIWEP